MSPPRVSVAVPLYNEEHGLPERDKRKIYFDNAVKLLRMEGKL